MSNHKRRSARLDAEALRESFMKVGNEGQFEGTNSRPIVDTLQGMGREDFKEAGSEQDSG